MTQKHGLIVAVPDASKRAGDTKEGAEPMNCFVCGRKVWLAPSSFQQMESYPDVDFDIKCPVCALGDELDPEGAGMQTSAIHLRKQIHEYGANLTLVTLAIKQLQNEGNEVYIGDRLLPKLD